jgi:hypothetical protein
MMLQVGRGPEQRIALQSERATRQEYKAYQRVGFETAVREQPMKSDGDPDRVYEIHREQNGNIAPAYHTIPEQDDSHDGTEKGHNYRDDHTAAPEDMLW